MKQSKKKSSSTQPNPLNALSCAAVYNSNSNNKVRKPQEVMPQTLWNRYIDSRLKQFCTR